MADYHIKQSGAEHAYKRLVAGGLQLDWPSFQQGARWLYRTAEMFEGPYADAERPCVFTDWLRRLVEDPFSS